MPGIATHHVFGCELYRRLDGVIGVSPASKQAFLLGNLGPDPFFHLVAAPALLRFSRVGQRMHASDPERLLDAVHRHAVVDAASEADGASSAYALGFLCHYLLDSTIHPLVYAQQHAIADGGVEGLPFEGPWLQRSVHATIETEIDEYLLTTHLGATAATYPPHEEMLRCSDMALGAISRRLSGALNDTYGGLQAPPGLFAVAVERNRSVQRLLDSKSGGLRARFDFLSPFGYAVSYLRALSPSGNPRVRTDFSNDDHIAWPHPFEPGATVRESFDELYGRAFDRALAAVPAFADHAFCGADCRELTRGVNFLGRRVG